MIGNPFRPFLPFVVTSPVSGGGPANPLLTNLLAWWEDADTIDKHLGVGLGATPGSVVAAPGGLNGWLLNGTNCVAGLNNAGLPTSGNYTVAMEVRRIGDNNQDQLLSQASGHVNLKSRNFGRILFEAFNSGEGSSSNFAFDDTGSFYSLVAVFRSDFTATLYINGVIRVSRSGSNTSAGWQYLFGPTTANRYRVGKIALWDRDLSATEAGDLTELKYDDL